MRVPTVLAFVLGFSALPARPGKASVISAICGFLGHGGLLRLTSGWIRDDRL